jgi:lipopolysaccharide biosynthesis glycosyltransferase
MNCIFICVFHQEQYVDMFYLLLESIKKYADLREDCDIVVYTNTIFMEKIMKHETDIILKFSINDSYSSITTACKARLDWFSLMHNYSKVLYIDTDVIIKNPIAPLFDICTNDVLYVLEEGLLTMHDDYYGGKSLFNEEIHNYEDISAFTSGILLFKNSSKIKWLFDKIKEDIIMRPFNFGCHDQPYIIYSAFKYEAYNNKIMKKYCVNNEQSFTSDIIIHHFPGGPGVFHRKIEIMTNFLKGLQIMNKGGNEHLSAFNKETILKFFKPQQYSLRTFPDINNEFLKYMFKSGDESANVIAIALYYYT